MKEPKIPVRWDEFTDLLIIDDGEEWDAVTEAFNRHYPDRAGLAFDPANYSQAEIDAVMVEFEPKQKPASASPSPATSD
jgi:hypothetical protein